MVKALIFESIYKPLKVEYSESTVINLLREGNGQAFEEVFRLYFNSLHSYAYTFMKDDELAEEIVQNVFCRIWEKRNQLKTEGSLKAYLYRSVHNESLNYIKQQNNRANLQVLYGGKDEESAQASEKVMVSELENHIQQALKELPEQCRTIFQMSRFEQLKYQQIADQLNLSIKTVENQMGKALKILRIKLAEFLVLVLYILTVLHK